MDRHMKDGVERRSTRWKVVAWSTPAILLLVPLVAGQFSNEVNWTAGDYVIAAVLLFGSLGAYELTSRVSRSTAYRAGAGLAIAAAFLLVWVNGAVGITDSGADPFFLLVPLIGFIGAVIARFKPRGMARAMFGAALAQGLIAATALIVGIVPDFNSPSEILSITAFFVMLLVGSALSFRVAARDELESAVP